MNPIQKNRRVQRLQRECIVHAVPALLLAAACAALAVWAALQAWPTIAPAEAQSADPGIQEFVTAA